MRERGTTCLLEDGVEWAQPWRKEKSTTLPNETELRIRVEIQEVDKRGKDFLGASTEKGPAELSKHAKVNPPAHMNSGFRET